MAFPTTITTTGAISQGCGGPFLSSAGNVYVIVRDNSGTSTGIEARKATDPTTSFSAVGTNPDTGNFVQTLAAYQVGDNVHVVTQSQVTSSQYNVKYHVFSMSSDSWTISNESVKGTYFTVTAPSGVGITVRSDGDVIVLYNGPMVANMGSDRDRVYYARREAAVWTVDVAVDNGGATSWLAGGSVLGSSDRTHFFFQGPAGTAYQRTLTSANALETFPASFDTTISTITSHLAQRGVSYVSGADTKVRFPYIDVGGTDVNSAKCNSADAPTMSTDANIEGDNLGSAASHITSFSANGTTLWHTFKNTNADIFTQSNANDAGWSAPESFYTGTVDKIYTSVYTRGGNIVLAMVFSETGPKYHEKLLLAGSSSVSESMTLADTPNATAIMAVSQTDSMTLADTPAATAIFPASITESMSLTETNDSFITKEVAQTDSMSLSDSESVTAAFAASQTDAMALADAPAATAVMAVSQTDSMSLADAPAATVTLPVSQTDSMSLADSTDATVSNLNVSQVDSMTLVDTPAATAVMPAASTEAMTLLSSQDATVTPAFSVPTIFGADEWPRPRRTAKSKPYREELEEDIRAVVQSFSPEEVVHVKVAQEIKETFITIVDSVDDASELAVLVAGLPVAVNAIVKEALLVVQEQQRLRARRRREEEILLL